MITITRRGANMGIAESNANSVPRRYEIAGQQLLFQAPAERLAAFEIEGESAVHKAELHSLPELSLLDKDQASLHYRGDAPFANQLQEVCCWRDQQRVQIEVSGEPVVCIDLATQHIQLLNDRSFDDDLNLEVITGPALILMLANTGIFCLHAGAVVTPHGTVALIAESGVGKSTLSRHIDEQWAQLADDVLALVPAGKISASKQVEQAQKAVPENRHVVQDFPQLKLPACQSAVRAGRETQLDLLLRLSPVASDVISFSKLSSTDAMLQVIRHSVAARLFDPAQLVEHTEFARLLTKQTTVAEIRYPRSLDQLGTVRQAITEYLQRL
ncbi:MAG: hypothetical protein AAF431_02140 [Pseudomonadota bacterium]